jgi:hypothetical protein
VGRDLRVLRRVLARVVRAEQELAHGQLHADVGLSAAAVAAVGCGQRVRGLAGGFHGLSFELPKEKACYQH